MSLKYFYETQNISLQHGCFYKGTWNRQCDEIICVAERMLPWWQITFLWWRIALSVWENCEHERTMITRHSKATEIWPRNNNDATEHCSTHIISLLNTLLSLTSHSYSLNNLEFRASSVYLVLCCQQKCKNDLENFWSDCIINVSILPCIPCVLVVSVF